MKILLLYPEFPDTFWSFKHALKFEQKRASSPPLGLMTIAAMIPQDWEKRLVDMNVHRLTDADLKWADLVFLSAMIVQQKSVVEVLARCQRLGVRVIAGGPLFTAEHERFEGVETFILNEGEITLPLWLEDLETGSTRHVYETDQYPDIRLTPIPLWHLAEREHYDAMSIQFSRGCPFNCDFCNITVLLGHTPRTKTAQQIVAELDALYAIGWRRNVFFVDDNFIGNKKVLKTEVLPALIEWRKGKEGCFFITEASINLADDKELLNMMVEAGFQSVFVGIETPDEAGLTECRKTQNKGRDLIESVKRLQRAGLQVMGGFIVGFDSDTATIFQRQIDFIQKSGIVTAMVGLLQAPYGTQLYSRLQDEGRLLKEMTGDNSDGSTNIVPKMDRALLDRGYRQIIRTIYAPRPFYQRVKTFLREYNPGPAKVQVGWSETVAFFKSVYMLGLIGEERLEYWGLIFWSLLRYPKKFPLAITFAIYRFHFNKVSQLQGL